MCVSPTLALLTQKLEQNWELLKAVFGKSLQILKIFAKCVYLKPRFLIMELYKIFSEVVFPPGMPDSKKKKTAWILLYLKHIVG